MGGRRKLGGDEQVSGKCFQKRGVVTWVDWCGDGQQDENREVSFAPHPLSRRPWQGKLKSKGAPWSGETGRGAQGSTVGVIFFLECGQYTQFFMHFCMCEVYPN